MENLIQFKFIVKSMKIISNFFNFSQDCYLNYIYLFFFKIFIKDNNINIIIFKKNKNY